MAEPVSFNSRSLQPPSAEQRGREALMREKGCIACRMLDMPVDCGSPEIHHQTIGGKHGAPRLGNDHTVCLGSYHHRGVAQSPALLAWIDAGMFGPSYAKTPKAFRRKFGSDVEQLCYQNKLIGWTAEPKRERRRKSRTTTDRMLPRRYGA